MNKYITDMLVEETSYKSIKNAYQRNDLSIVLHDGYIWYFEKCSSNRLYDRVKKEMKRLFPEYIHITELNFNIPPEQK